MITRQLALAACAVMVLSVAALMPAPATPAVRMLAPARRPAPPVSRSPPVGRYQRTPADEDDEPGGRRQGHVTQDAQRQQQGQPTAAQQAQGAKPSAKMADQGC